MKLRDTLKEALMVGSSTDDIYFALGAQSLVGHVRVREGCQVKIHCLLNSVRGEEHESLHGRGDRDEDTAVRGGGGDMYGVTANRRFTAFLARARGRHRCNATQRERGLEGRGVVTYKHSAQTATPKGKEGPTTQPTLVEP